MILIEDDPYDQRSENERELDEERKNTPDEYHRPDPDE